MIRNLNRGLTADAEPALADRIGRIAFELPRKPHPHEAALTVALDLGVAFDHPHGDAAARPAQRTEAWLPFRDARNEILLRNESNQLILRTAAACERGR